MRTCNKCNIEKELNKENFQTNAQSVGGFRWNCKDCSRKYLRERYAKNKEQIRKDQKDKYWENPEKAREDRRNGYARQVATEKGKLKRFEDVRNWKLNNKYRVRELGRKYQEKLRKENPEKVKEAWNKYYLSHKVEMSIKAHSRRVAGSISYTSEEWISRCEEFNDCCAFCLIKFPRNELTVEHFLPISKNGGNEIENIIPACRSCNAHKHNKTPIEVINGVMGNRLFS